MKAFGLKLANAFAVGGAFCPGHTASTLEGIVRTKITRP